MKEELKDLIKNKKILILGFGREGKSTFKVLQQIGGYEEIAVADRTFAEIPVKGYFGEDYMKAVDDYDIVFKTPGIALEKPRNEYSAFITSQTEIFLKYYRDRVIGITGTKGKSTVSSLLYHLFKESGKDAYLGGNIGIPIWDLEENIGEKSVIIMELSCHQLEYCDYSPHIAVFLNLYEDHLDRYINMENYYRAKKNIYLNQNNKDFLYCIKALIPVRENSGIIIVPEISNLPFKSLEEIKANLRGEHNLMNVAFAYEITKRFLNDEDFIRILKSFNPLPHRLEFIGTYNGVDFYDDSISTTSQSAIEAVKSVKNAETLLLGGMDRGIDYSELLEFLYSSGLQNVILMYKSGKRIYDTINSERFKGDIYYVEDLYEAVKKSRLLTHKGGAVILSPASASYGYFKNFEERGEEFKKAVKKDF